LGYFTRTEYKSGTYPRNTGNRILSSTTNGTLKNLYDNKSIAKRIPRIMNLKLH